MFKTPTLRARILKKEVVLGTFQKINSPTITEMIGQAGFDFIVIDTEHANFTCCDVENLIRAADSVGLGSVVRVRNTNADEILHALDSGADGVQIPDLETVEQAADALRSTKYYPQGNRGMSMAQRSAMYGGWNGEQKYVPFSNENSLVTAHVENVGMAEHIDELLKLPQLDVVFVGPGDLSQSMGKPGQINDPEVQAVVERVFQKTLAAGKAVGMYCANTAAMEKYIKMGATYVLLAADVNCFGAGLRGLRGEFDVIMAQA